MPDNRRHRGRAQVDIAGILGAFGNSTAQANPYFGMDQETANAMQGGRAVDTDMPYQRAGFLDRLAGNEAEQLNQQYTTAKLLGELQGQQRLKQLPQEEALKNLSEKEMIDYRSQSTAKSHKKQLRQGERSSRRLKESDMADVGNAVMGLVGSGVLGNNELTTAYAKDPVALGNILAKLPQLVTQLEAAGKAQFAQPTGSLVGEQAMRKAADDVSEFQYNQDLRDTRKPKMAELADIGLDTDFTTARFQQGLAGKRLDNLDQYTGAEASKLQSDIIRNSMVPIPDDYVNPWTGEQTSVPRPMNAKDEANMQLLQSMGLGGVSTAKPVQQKRLLKVVNGRPVYYIP